jgi:hypothetical protein
VVIALVGFALRVAYALFKGDQGILGDAIFYKIQSQILADGHGFLTPGLYAFAGRSVASAEHPPLYTIWLAAAQLVGVHGVVGLRLWSAVLGLGTVAFAGLAGRELAGERAGLIGAGLVAVSPLLVMTDGLIMSESITATVVAATIWLAARALRLRTPASMAIFGAVAALGALARAELVLVIPIVAVAALCHRRADTGRRRLELVGAALAAGALVMAPWVVRNLVTFERPVLLSDGWDLTVVGANCRSTYSGPLIGTNDLRCGAGVRDDVDQSVAFAEARTTGLRYARHHVDRWPAVAFARLGRTFGFFNVRQQITFDHDFERRERALSTAGFVVWWASVAVGIGGLVALHRRRVSIVPLLAPVAAVAVAVAVTYGNTRLRVPADVAMLLAAAVGVDAWLQRRRARTTPSSPEPERSGGEQLRSVP